MRKKGENNIRCAGKIAIRAMKTIFTPLFLKVNPSQQPADLAAHRESSVAHPICNNSFMCGCYPLRRAEGIGARIDRGSTVPSPEETMSSDTGRHGPSECGSGTRWIPIRTSRTARSTPEAPMHGLRDPVRSSQRGDRYRRCGAILASGWRAVHGTHREGFCPIFSLRLRQGSMELQTASRLAAKFGSFNGDEDQVFRTGRSVEISPLLEFGRPVFWLHA